MEGNFIRYLDRRLSIIPSLRWYSSRVTIERSTPIRLRYQPNVDVFTVHDTRGGSVHVETRTSYRSGLWAVFLIRCWIAKKRSQLDNIDRGFVLCQYQKCMLPQYATFEPSDSGRDCGELFTTRKKRSLGTSEEQKMLPWILVDVSLSPAVLLDPWRSRTLIPCLCVWGFITWYTSKNPFAFKQCARPRHHFISPIKGGPPQAFT